MTEKQQEAVSAITAEAETGTFLLHGVTGSGKTEVYLESIHAQLERGRQAILLVPEISLTPMMVKRFKRRFGERVAVLHSGLSLGEKYDEWRKIAQGEVDVVVGARSAVFAPLTNIGIIILDEEHETTYKQEENPRYHTRDVAKWRAAYHRCPVVLGSATPLLETYARAQKGSIVTYRFANDSVGNCLRSTSLICVKNLNGAIGLRSASRSSKVSKNESSVGNRRYYF